MGGSFAVPLKLGDVVSVLSSSHVTCLQEQLINLQIRMILLFAQVYMQGEGISVTKSVNREDKRSRRYRDRHFAKFERSRRYRDR